MVSHCTPGDNWVPNICGVHMFGLWDSHVFWLSGCEMQRIQKRKKTGYPLTESLPIMQSLHPACLGVVQKKRLEHEGGGGVSG